MVLVLHVMGLFVCVRQCQFVFSTLGNGMFKMCDADVAVLELVCETPFRVFKPLNFNYNSNSEHTVQHAWVATFLSILTMKQTPTRPAWHEVESKSCAVIYAHQVAASRRLWLCISLLMINPKSLNAQPELNYKATSTVCLHK